MAGCVVHLLGVLDQELGVSLGFEMFSLYIKGTPFAVWN